MSYCRWSSDNFYCDLYCYESDAGYETHVANNRHYGPLAAFPWYGESDWEERYRIYGESHDTATRVPIELPEAGASYIDDTLDEFEARLLHLREIGYVFPDHVFEEIAEERALPPYDYLGVVA